MIKRNYGKLLGRMKELGYSQNEVAKLSGMCISRFSQKLNNLGQFTQENIHNICNVLKIDIKNVGEYFFLEESFDNTPSIENTNN